jgi:hypothetical protein
MICPDCHQHFDDDVGFCSRCGELKGVVKTSTILISAGEIESMYRSVEDVPDPLKSQLLRSTNGLNSATIVIADRQGRKEIAKAIRNLPAPGQSRPAGPPEPPKAKLLLAIPHVIGALLLLIAACLVWLVFHHAG